MPFAGFKFESLGYQEWATLSLMVLFILSIVVASFLSRRIWLLVISGISLLQGLMLCIRPEFGISNVSEILEKNIDVDGVHILTARYFGIFLLANAVIYYRFSERDSDPTIFTTLTWSCVLTVSLLTLNFVYSFLSVSSSKSKSTAWQTNDVLVGLGFILMVVEILGGLIQLYRCPSWGGYPETFTRLNVHIRIDYFIVFIGGIASFALPHWFLELETTIEKPGPTHLYMLRALGICLISSSLVMGRCPNFLRDNDKVTLLEVRIVEVMVMMLLQVYAHNKYNLFTNKHVFLDMTTHVVLTINAALGYWSAKGYPKFKST